ncbi:hypothetical protein JNW88_18050, partial [Micromonospora sp. ATA32]|nr:hypothetical protein [Micromonospora sp. ATA32]
IVQGWINYYGRFYKSMLYPLLRRINEHLVRWAMGQLRRHLTNGAGRWVIAADGVEYFRIEGVTVSRYTYRGNKIPTPWPTTTNPA